MCKSFILVLGRVPNTPPQVLAQAVEQGMGLGLGWGLRAPFCLWCYLAVLLQPVHFFKAQFLFHPTAARIGQDYL